jgi:ribosome-associated heat shock protein Hsp15
MSDAGAQADAARLDKWLWSVRVFKTRSQASAACRGGSVTVNGTVAKPSRDLRGGEIVLAKVGLIQRTFRVLGVPPSRVGAKLVPDFCEDQTPPAELEKAREKPVQHFLARARGQGRPTKRERREIDRFLDSEE